MSYGDYEFYRRQYQKFDADVSLTGDAVTATEIVTVKNASYTLYVQRCVVSIQTHVDGKVFTLQDDNSTPKVLCSFLDDAEGDTTWGGDHKVFDFGPAGIPCTEGKSLEYLANTGGSGFVGKAHIEGYQKLTAVLSSTAGASSQ